MAAFALALLAVVQAGASIPTPEEFFGFAMGSDRHVATYQKTADYLAELARRSPWIRVDDLGKTTLGLHQSMAVISTPANLERSSRWQEIAARLLDPRKTTPDEAAALADEGRAIVMVTCGIHSDEVGSPHTAVELAYDLVANRGLPFDRESVLREVVFLLVPSVNPDGQEIVADWIARTAGTEDDGAPLPRLYHAIAGHDDNRDWFAFNLPETRNVGRVLFRTWRPHVLIDHHQMGARGARFFVPPFGDPISRNVHPLVWRGANLFGQAMAMDLESAGKAGVVHDAYYQGWWQGGLSRAPWWHHAIGILTEAASPAQASPLSLDASELEPGSGMTSILEPTAKQPNPWPGGTWRLRDVCDYQRIATFAALRLAADRRKTLLANTYAMASEAITRAGVKSPAAFVLPRTQRDPAARDRLLEMLRLGGVEVLEASSPFEAGGRAYEAGSAIVSLAQPFGPYALDLLEDQRYPDALAVQRPYDVTGWTLWRMMGVACDRVERPFAMPKATGPLEAIKPRSTFRTAPEGGRFLAIDARSNDAYVAAARVLMQQLPLRRSPSPIAIEGGGTLEAGAFLVEAASVPAGGGWLVDGLSIDVAPVAASSKPASLLRVAAPRIGIYEAWDPSIDKGWTHWLVDRYVWKPQVVHNADLKDVLPRCDAFVIPESKPDVLWDGGARSDVKLGRTPFPKEYRGGIGADGVKALREFVERGGTLVALGEACDFLVERMDLPVTNPLKGVEKKEFSCPGSLLRLEVDAEHPLGFGMQSEAAGMVTSGVAFRTTPGNPRFQRSVVARFPADGDLCLSGWLKGDEKLRGLAAVVELEFGKGRVVLLGVRAQHRAQTDATFKLLFNALYGATTKRE
ncbi:MAG TPA: M14 metallopeptidase family protein [Planctomycetota bacterium]|nr:M14 metallopeptidase family protein [Planctomycetota bacterium]